MAWAYPLAAVGCRLIRTLAKGLFVFLNTGPCNWTQWSLLFPAYEARREGRGMALPSEGRLAPAPCSCPVHELPGVLQRRNPGTGVPRRGPLSWSIQNPSIVKD